MSRSKAEEKAYPASTSSSSTITTTSLPTTMPQIAPLETEENTEKNDDSSCWTKFFNCCVVCHKATDPLIIQAGEIVGAALKVTIGTFIQASPLPPNAKEVAIKLAEKGIDAIGTAGLAGMHKLDQIAMEHATKAMSSSQVKKAIKQALEEAGKAVKPDLKDTAVLLQQAEKALVDQVKKTVNNNIEAMKNLTDAQKAAAMEAADVSIDNLNNVTMASLTTIIGNAMNHALTAADASSSSTSSGNNTLTLTTSSGIAFTNIPDIPAEQLQKLMLAVNGIPGLADDQKRAVLDLLLTKTLGSALTNSSSSASDAIALNNSTSSTSTSTSTALLTNKDSSSKTPLESDVHEPAINPLSPPPLNSPSPHPTQPGHPTPKKKIDYAKLLYIEDNSSMDTSHHNVVLTGAEETPNHG